MRTSQWKWPSAIGGAVCLWIVGLAGESLRADVKLASLFTDHIVLQQQMPIVPQGGDDLNGLRSRVDDEMEKAMLPPLERARVRNAVERVEWISRLQDADVSLAEISALLRDLESRHVGTEAMKGRICAAADQAKNQAPAGPSLSDVLGSAATLPEATVAKKSGGGTFDTLSGNALTR